MFNLFIKFYWNYRVKQHLILLLRLNKFSTSDINWLQDNFSNNKHGRKSLNTVCEVPTLKRNIYFVWNTKWFMGTCKLRNETKRNWPKRNEIDAKRNWPKRNGIIQNEIKPILTKQILGERQHKN